MPDNPPQADPASISDAAYACRESFRECLAIKSLTRQEWAENRLADFNLWAAGIDAFANTTASLDQRLAFKPEVRTVVTNLLITMQIFIKDCKELGRLEGDDLGEGPSEVVDNDESGGGAAIGAIFPEEDLPRPSSPWSDAPSSDSGKEMISKFTSSNQSLTEAIKSTEAILDQLIRLTFAIRKSGTTSRLQKADRSFDPERLDDFRRHLNLVLLTRSADIERKRTEAWRNCPNDAFNDIRVDFDVDETQLNSVQRRLVDANLRRRNRFLYAQDHSKKMAGSQTHPQKATASHKPANQLDQVVNEMEIRQSIREPTSSQKRDVTTNNGFNVVSDTVAESTTTASAVDTTISFDMQKKTTNSRHEMTQVSSITLKMAYPRPPKGGGLGFNLTSCPLCAWADAPGAIDECNALLDHVAEHIHEFSLRALPWASAVDEEDTKILEESNERCKDWSGLYDMPERQKDHHAKHRSQDDGDYFRQNAYFAESSQGSSIASMDAHASDRSSEESSNLDLQVSWRLGLSILYEPLDPTAAVVE
ncbi:hypothetical protein IMSHALPRED_003356 [Imshaugia aleurites]|uniref:Uncharacterized protein n=1 Tax=Imshaugia aleurites TaxID=172621 RepID=A0A8H3IDN6_9LECA|nr:hypothetical protein IMSHALPRED_003356 [Imshaugia aleurites]